MKAAAVTAILLWQFAIAPAPAPPAEPRHFPYERKLHVAPGHSGEACATLDAAVFANAANASLNDARVYVGGSQVNGSNETASLIDENTTQTAEDEPAAPRNITVGHGDLRFDLEMPHHAYSAVVLNLAAHDFVALASVSATPQGGSAPVNLGTFPVFDLTSQKLARSTALPLQEETYPELHVTLHPVLAAGMPLHVLKPETVREASVPPSREAEVLYTPVAETSSITQRGRQTIATLRLLAHVPAERIAFALAPGYRGSFLRGVTVTARPDQAQDSAAVESVSGEISQVTNLQLPAELSGWRTLFEFRKLALDTTLGANLRQGATVEVAIDNGKNQPLPITSIQLQMRRRRVCFWASPGQSDYTLMYGDATLRAPVYQYNSGFYAASAPVLAALGPQQPNPDYVARRDTRTYAQRHPELWWVVLLGALATLGSVARHRTST